MESLTTADCLLIRQKKELGEILTGFETRNRYEVDDSVGRTLYQVEEDGGSTLARLFLRAMRPFTLCITNGEGRNILTLNRPFRFYFHELEIRGDRGEHLGTVTRRFTLLRRRYVVCDETGAEILELFGPLLHPWTFEVRFQGEAIGKITKKWSGVLKEALTDADNFAVTFPAKLKVPIKSLLFGAVFLIDFVHFENNGKR